MKAYKCDRCMVMHEFDSECFLRVTEINPATSTGCYETTKYELCPKCQALLGDFLRGTTKEEEKNIGERSEM